MKHHRDRKRGMSGLIALLLFGVFAVCILSVLLTGAHVYRSVTARDRETGARWTSAQYVAEKVRQASDRDAVDVSDFDGVDALCLYEDIEGIRFVTRVYCYDGWLRELFAAESGDFSPEDGQRVTEAEDMELALEDGLLNVRLANKDGGDTEMKLFLRGKGASE